ncbi:hypothetical protein NPIL_357911, partial [Nephila pilipes]
MGAVRYQKIPPPHLNVALHRGQS